MTLEEAFKQFDNMLVNLRMNFHYRSLATELSDIHDQKQWILEVIKKIDLTLPSFRDSVQKVILVVSILEKLYDVSVMLEDISKDLVDYTSTSEKIESLQHQAKNLHELSKVIKKEVEPWKAIK